MPNENSYFIPKENFPKIAEVRHWEEDQKLLTPEEWAEQQKIEESYSDEFASYGDMGAAKSYGPCDYHNPRCACYVSEGFVPLNIACPACSAREPHQWIHASCGGQAYISRNVRIKCMGCQVEHHWKDWSWKCNDVNHTGYRQATSSNSFLSALSIAAGMNSEDGGTTEIIADITIKLIQEARSQAGRIEEQ